MDQLFAEFRISQIHKLCRITAHFPNILTYSKLFSLVGAAGSVSVSVSVSVFSLIVTKYGIS